MALETVTNQASSKSAAKKNKKKDVPLDASTPEEVAVTIPAEVPLSDTATIQTGTPDPSQESPYIREMQKNIRNVTKKLAAMQKLDVIIAENPNTSLEELVNTRKINNDQKAQALKKPALQAQLVQLEEQVAQFKKFEDEFRAQATREKMQLEETHRGELEELRATAKAEATAEGSQATRQKLLTLSKFLRAAAARRQMEDDLSEESRAFEGLLLLLYGGDNVAVDAAEKLITGSDQGVPSTDDQLLNVTYSKIKELSEAYAPFAAEEAWRQEVADAEQTDLVAAAGSRVVPITDPTVTHAGLTELNNVPTSEAPPQPSGVEPSNIDPGAANVAASTWDATPSSATLQEPMTGSWTHISRDTLEAESPAAETLPTNGTQSWADEAQEMPTAAPAAVAAAPPGDGFHEVHHGRNAGRSRGGFDKGGRGRGGFRGDGTGHRGRGGFRGDRGGGEFRGRGRGGGGAGGHRGAPRGSA